MFTRISIVAGKILDVLEDRVGPVTIKERDMIIDEPIAVITMSVGWLTRESYVVLRKKDEDYFIYLSSEVTPAQSKIGEIEKVEV